MRDPKQEMRARRAQQHRHAADSGQAASKGGGQWQGPGPKLLLQVCWDFHCPGGCQRQSCKWRHCPLDEWQVAWLQLQRFIFGAQLNTFDGLAGLGRAVRIAFSEAALPRLQTDTPPVLAAGLRTAVVALGRLGYPFPGFEPSVPLRSESDNGHNCGGRTGRIELLAALRFLAAQTLPHGTQVLPVGSFAWGIDTDGSDLDVVLASPGGDEQDTGALEILAAALSQGEARCALLPQTLSGATFVLRGRGTGVPVLTIFTNVRGQHLSADICCAGQLSSVRDALLFRHMIARMPRLGPTLQVFKRWLRARAMPSSSEGCFPQIFWMRLAARTFQQAAANATASGATARGGAPPATFADWRAAPGSQHEAQAALLAPPLGAAPGRAVWVPARPLKVGGDCFDEVGLVLAEARERAVVREQLGGFCAWWSVMLPGWGDPLNLSGEDPVPQLKRLGAGVHGATALLALHELREMAAVQAMREVSGMPEEMPTVQPHRHLCPIEAGFWGAFLVPGPSAEGESGAGQPSQLIHAYVYRVAGPADEVRQCVCPRCCWSGGAGHEVSCEPPMAKRPQEYVSRRDGEWLFWAISPRSAQKEEGGEARHCLVWKRYVFSPTHLVTTLSGNPLTDPGVASEFLKLCSLISPPAVSKALPPAYPTLRYSRRVLLGLGLPSLGGLRSSIATTGAAAALVGEDAGASAEGAAAESGRGREPSPCR